tara:strand:+ start:2432 stop:3517 length:1086 start_codon:yes stop_codon:yes gene_type:complete
MQKWMMYLVLPVVAFISVGVASGLNQQAIIGSSPIDNMPLVEPRSDDKPHQTSFAPQEDRGPEYRRFLAPSLKIRAGGSSGSGTICFYDEIKNEAWVISCGHLWSGNKSASSPPRDAKVVTWYHNDQKLSEPKTYPAKVIFYSNKRGWDISLLKFQPDWTPEYFPIAPLNYPIKIGMRAHSVGCDGAREVARYDVEVIDLGGNGDDLRTRRNSPRPGRSGGGLLTEDGYFIGICWGTTAFDGSGTGLFTALGSIHNVYKREGYGWLLDVPPSGGMARRIPIRDMEGPQRQYDRKYIPLPTPNRRPIPSHHHLQTSPHHRPRLSIQPSPHPTHRLHLPRPHQTNHLSHHRVHPRQSSHLLHP